VITNYCRYTVFGYSNDYVLNKIKKTRSEAEAMKNILSKISDDDVKDDYLMREFIIENFSGYRHRIVHKYLYRNPIANTNPDGTWSLIRLISLPFFIALVLYWLLKYNPDIGSRATDMWMIITFFAFFQDLLVIEPLKIWFKCVFLVASVNEELVRIIEILSKRFKYIMLRDNGTTKDIHNLVQHFSPTVRVARTQPHLPVARLLIAINDYDVPYFLPKQRRNVAPNSDSLDDKIKIKKSDTAYKSKRDVNSVSPDPNDVFAGLTKNVFLGILMSIPESFLESAILILIICIIDCLLFFFFYADSINILYSSLLGLGFAMVLTYLFMCYYYHEVVTILVNAYKSIMKFIFPPFSEGKQKKRKLFGRKSNKILISNVDVDLNNDTDTNSEYKSNDLDLDSKSVQTNRTKPRAITSDSSQVSSSKSIFPDERHHQIVEQNYYKTNSINGPSEELDSMSALSTMHSQSNSMFKPRASINSNGAKVKLEPINLDSNTPSRKIRQETNNLIIESIHEMSSIIENEIDNFSVEVSKRKKKKSRSRNYDVETRNNNVNTKNIKPPAYRPLSAKKRLVRRPLSGPGERYETKESENESEIKDNDSIFPLWH